MNIIIKKNLFIYKNFKTKCSIGKNGTNKRKFEGDLKTPKGIFKLGKLYNRKDRNININCKIKYIIFKKNMGWCDDSKSIKYNKEITFPFKFNAEKLYRKNKIYDLFINIKYNTNPTIKKRGSAIFLHLADKKYKPTKGCVAILKKDFLKILPMIKKDTKISIS